MRKASRISKTILDQAYSYESYVQLLQQLVADGKSTGLDQRADLIQFTALNAHRMKRVYKTTQVEAELIQTLSKLNESLTWLIISESWCGDAAQILPVLAKISEGHFEIDLKIILRDENLDLMEDYLTNGTRSIPKLICLDASLNEVFVWGPRPQKIQHLMNELKERGITDHAVLVEHIQNAYNQDRAASIQAEIKSIINELISI